MCMAERRINSIASNVIPFFVFHPIYRIALFIDAASRNDAVQVRIQGHRLPPGVKDSYHSCLRTQPSMVMAKSVEHMPRTLKEYLIDFSIHMQTKWFNVSGKVSTIWK